MRLKLLEGSYTIFSLNRASDLSICVDTNDFYYITQFKDELSLICSDTCITNEYRRYDAWKLVEIIQPVGIYLTNIAEKLNKTLDSVSESVFKISGWDSDYILVKDEDIKLVCETLTKRGYKII